MSRKFISTVKQWYYVNEDTIAKTCIIFVLALNFIAGSVACFLKVMSLSLSKFNNIQFVINNLFAVILLSIFVGIIAVIAVLLLSLVVILLSEKAKKIIRN